MPGELEMRRQDEFIKTGYEVSPALESELLGYAVEFGIAEAGTEFAVLVSTL